MTGTTSSNWLRRAWPLWATLAYALVAIITTHPLWLSLGQAIPSDIGDPLLNTWIQAWDARALLTSPLHLFDTNIFYPLPNTLAYSEHLISTAILALPIQALTGEPVLAYNLSLLLSFPLAGLGMYLLVLRWTGRHSAAFLAGLAFAFAPYRLSTIAHLQLLTVQWLPFGLLALDQLLGRPRSGERVRRPAAPIARLVIFSTLQVLASWYLAVFSMLVMGFYVLGWLIASLWPKQGEGNQTRGVLPALGRLLIAGAIIGLLVLPLALPYLEVLPQLRATRPVSWALSFGSRPTDLVAAAPFLTVTGPLTQSLTQRKGFTEENTLYLGLAVCLLALVGLLLGRPRWRTLTLATLAVVSLMLTFAGPYESLANLFPLISIVRVPPRWILPAVFALAGLAGYGLAAIRSDALRYAVLAGASLILILESLAAPLPLAQVGSLGGLPPVYKALDELNRELPGAVVELPMHVAPAPEYPETKRLYASTLGWWKLVNGYSGFTPERQVELGQRLAAPSSPGGLAALRQLGAEGTGYLVVHPDEAPLDRERWDATDRWLIERQTTLIPAGRIGPDELYRINPLGDRLFTEDEHLATMPPSVMPVRVDAQLLPPTGPGQIELLAYLYQPPTLEQSGPGRLTLYWRTSAPLDGAYTVFVHALDEHGQMIGQADGPPVANHYPTSTWQPGEIVQDSRLASDAARYLVGLYSPETGERLQAFGPSGSRRPDDAVVIIP